MHTVNMNSVCLYNGTVISGYAAMEKCSILTEDGIIREILSNRRFEEKRREPGSKVIDINGAFIAPGFIDTHIHGIHGIGADDAVYPEPKPEEEVIEIMIEFSRLLLKEGVTSFNPTIYPSPGDTMPDAIAKVVSSMGKEKGSRIMGLHLEGPFISPDMLGVQRPETIRPVDLEYMEKLWNASKGNIINMTVAPELKNMRELALYCTGKGIILQAGHTNATYENMVEGMQAGIFHSTHMFNAMSKLNQRNPNAVGAILTNPEMSFEIIADGVHVHPVLFKLLAQNTPSDRIVMITDSLKCSNQETGPFYANGEEMITGGGVCRRKKDDVIGGSEITMIKGLRNLVKFGFPLENAVKAASSNPAAIMRYAKKGSIAPGMDADLTVFDKDFTVLATIVGGELRYSIIS